MHIHVKRMRHIFRAIASVLFVFIFTIGAAAAEGTASGGPDPIRTNNLDGWPKASEKLSDYVCVLDTSTDTVLIDKNMDVMTPPASLTKIMTTLVALENGNPDDRIRMTEAGLKYAASGSSNLYTTEGESFLLKDMLYGVMLASANDMATQVAEHIGGGSVDNFVAMMNDKAAELGCTGTHFINACGMPAEGQVSTAHDMAVISEEALKNEVFREIVSTMSYTIPATEIYAAREITNHHPMLSNPETYPLEGVIGGKTGYTDAAGNCLATYCERDGRLIICVTMHADGIGNCLYDTMKCYKYAYGKWALKKVKTRKGEELIGGGEVLVPKKKKVRNCEKTETVTGTDDGRERVDTVYYWSGVPVGTSSVIRTGMS